MFSQARTKATTSSSIQKGAVGATGDALLIAQAHKVVQDYLLLLDGDDKFVLTQKFRAESKASLGGTVYPNEYMKLDEFIVLRPNSQHPVNQTRIDVEPLAQPKQYVSELKYPTFVAHVHVAINVGQRRSETIIFVFDELRNEYFVQLHIIRDF
ncbi:MAG: hypothetical protein EZS28_026801 [Streblomastix strix]|uniref:Uncharacterized protein n=1 Tax=Streblomastix strix TaxID=222440 RepID=A0A5J4V540_9EUKA|nr:MAG: hypothetical protein EZS28_026801 [Streblomastix strix]